ncbi:MAG: hypothetical protein GX765_05620, partial [Candidatus Moranbacteria bacterium]|nr:hypothetical protein [Candidatus Moranbacteria bacterium]
MKSNIKVISSGNVLEVYEYEKEQYFGHEGKGGRKKTESEEWEKIRKQSMRTARNNIRRKILSNFDNHSKFITLTFRDDEKINIKDVAVCNDLFNKFIKRLKYRYKDFKYLTVIEFQDGKRRKDKKGRGAVHYHMISELPYIPFKELKAIWGHGGVYINDIRHVDNVGAYLIKYMCEDVYDERLKGKKSYFSSRNLEKSEIFRGDEAELILEVYKNKEPVY